VIADPDQVSQIFWNLARNSLRAMPGGGTLTIVGRLDEEHYRMQVIDTGRGMTEEQRANLFHPFQSFFDGGTGIGMAIVYRIVQEHGGRLDVESRPGGGTTITVELPAMPASPVVQTAAAGAEAP
jgi:signal transduction histidine kinase